MAVITAGVFAIVVLAGVLHYTDAPPVAVFVLSGAALGGVAWAIGIATESVGAKFGPAVTGVGVRRAPGGRCEAVVSSSSSLSLSLSSLIEMIPGVALTVSSSSSSPGSSNSAALRCSLADAPSALSRCAFA